MQVQRLVRWKPTRSTEKTAVSKHGDVWLVKPHSVGDGRLLVVPKDSPGSDMRWIYSHQVLEEV